MQVLSREFLGCYTALDMIIERHVFFLRLICLSQFSLSQQLSDSFFIQLVKLVYPLLVFVISSIIRVQKLVLQR